MASSIERERKHWESFKEKGNVAVHEFYAKYAWYFRVVLSNHLDDKRILKVDNPKYEKLTKFGIKKAVKLFRPLPSLPFYIFLLHYTAEYIQRLDRQKK